MPKFQSPQEKKSLSYRKDRRNDYGESNKGSRKIIPRNKAQGHRDNRRFTKQTIDVILTAGEEISDVAQSTLKNDLRRIGGWKKCPDAPLGEIVANNLRYRKIINDNKRSNNI